MAPTEDALELIQEAAGRGVPEAQALYGQMLLDGIHIPANPFRALHWFERAALGGHLMAINMVGRCLENGWGATPSPSMAARWYRKAAERGLDWGMYNLATLLTLGRGVAEDRVEAIYWLRKAAALGHAKSLNLPGGFYEDGWELEPDWTIARDLYHRAAAGGDFRGQFNFGRLLAQEGKMEEALFWLRKVPETATPAFLSKMQSFLEPSPIPALRDFAQANAGSFQVSRVRENIAVATSDPTTAQDRQ